METVEMLGYKSDMHRQVIEYRHLEWSIGTVADAGAAEQVCRAIKGKGAFLFFKDTASRLGLLDRWYQYRDAPIREFVTDWATAKSTPYVGC